MSPGNYRRIHTHTHTLLETCPFWRPLKVAMPLWNISLGVQISNPSQTSIFRKLHLGLSFPPEAASWIFASCSQSCHSTGRFWGIPTGRGLHSWVLEVPFVCYCCTFGSVVTQGNCLFIMQCKSFYKTVTSPGPRAPKRVTGDMLIFASGPIITLVNFPKECLACHLLFRLTYDKNWSTGYEHASYRDRLVGPNSLPSR